MIGKSAEEQEADERKKQRKKIAAQAHHNDRMRSPQASLFGLEGDNLPPRAPTLHSTVMK